MLRTSRADGCFYEFEWYTAAACVLSRTEGDNCTVFDAQAGVCSSTLWGSLTCKCFYPFCFVFKHFSVSMLGVACFRIISISFDQKL